MTNEKFIREASAISADVLLSLKSIEKDFAVFTEKLEDQKGRSLNCVVVRFPEGCAALHNHHNPRRPNAERENYLAVSGTERGADGRLRLTEFQGQGDSDAESVKDGVSGQARYRVVVRLGRNRGRRPQIHSLPGQV